MNEQRCLFCGGDASEPNHEERCDGRQGAVEAALPEYQPHEHARETDPDTSHAAAWSITNATEVQARVVELFKSHPAGLTDEELLALYARAHPRDSRSLESLASPRKRRSDLANAGVLRDSGERRPLTSGRQGIVWTLAAVAVLT